MTILMLGAPGCGKGTQGKFVADRLGVPIISTGDMLRAAIREGSDVGLKAKALVEAGELVSDEIVIAIVKERVAKDDCKEGYILDGFPRTMPQAEALEDAGLSPDVVLNLHVDDAVIEARMTGRRVCSACSLSYHTESNKPKQDGVCDRCGGALSIRNDDTPATVLARLHTYHAQTEPLIAFYQAKNKLRTVLGADGVQDTAARVKETLGK